MARSSGRCRSWLRRTALLGVSVPLVLLVPAPAASAHPLGNFTINHYDGLLLYPDRIENTAVVDTAEIPTISQRNAVDSDGDDTVTADERSAFASDQCDEVAAELRIEVDGTPLSWSVASADFTYRPGAAGLETSRLECALTTQADLSKPAVVEFTDGYLADRLGWREITAAGDGVALDEPSVPAQSISDELRGYPNDLLSSPLDQRSVRLTTAPGQGTDLGVAPTVPDAGFVTRALASATALLERLVGGAELTVSVGLLALLLSLVLGAAHAALPGHGKTIMAAYMVGTRGTPKDAVLVGVTVTLAHTAGVLILGLLFQAGATFAGDSLLAVLGVLSGLLVAVIGLGLLRAALKGRGYDTLSAEHSHGHGSDHSHDHGFGHSHTHGDGPTHVHDDSRHSHDHDGHSHDHDGHSHDHDGHSHSHRHDDADHHQDAKAEARVPVLVDTHSHSTSEIDAHDHDHRPADRGYKRLTLVGMGLAGGLVPSPSALVVLIASIGLGRTGFGVALVLGYGVGMAATLIAVGYLIARLPDRLGRLRTLGKRPIIARIVRFGAVITAGLVLVVGLVLALGSAVPLV